MTIRDIRNLPKDLDRQISKDFNALIKKVHRTFSTKTYSPVYTGFFASSWKAQSSPVRPKDRIEKFQPWAGIKRQATENFLKSSVADPAFKSTGFYNVKSVIKPRFPEYAVYALEGGKLQLFIQGSLGKLIKETMTDKGKLFVASGATSGFGSAPPGVSYTEF